MKKEKYTCKLCNAKLKKPEYCNLHFKSGIVYTFCSNDCLIKFRNVFLNSNNIEWFLDRIGKKVYRSKTSCSCEICQHVYENGLIIENKMHAMYIAELEGLSFHEDEAHIFKYFDTKEEVIEFEKELKQLKE